MHTNMSYETGFGDESHTLMQATYHEYDDAEIPLDHAERLFSEGLDALPPMERPLAMATRLLETCATTGRLGFIALKDHSECLLRFRHLVHLWIKIPLTTIGAMLVQGRESYDDRWLYAAKGMRPALMELALSRKDPILTTKEIASLPDGRTELEPFADWLRTDQEVQERVVDMWNSIVRQGQHVNLPGAFSVPLVNGTEISKDDLWLCSCQFDYGRM